MIRGERSRLDLTRTQILAFRRNAGGLDVRRAPGPDALRRAAWAGLQDSMPRAALLSIHARLEGTEPATWQDPSLVQVWGPRYSVFVVAARDLAVFTLGTLPDAAKGRHRAEDVAARLRAVLGGTPMAYGQAGRALGVPPNRLRYAAATGTVLIRWDGARQPVIWTVPPPQTDPHCRAPGAHPPVSAYLRPSHGGVLRPVGGVGRQAAAAAFEALGRFATRRRHPAGEGWILTRDEAAFRTAPGPAAPARLLPSGDAYFLLEAPIATCWCQTPGSVRRCGLRGCGPAACWSGERSLERGAAPTR